MGYPKEAIIDTLRSIAFGAVGAGYSAVGASFAGPVRLIGITNLTDQDLVFSDDGVNDKIILPSGAGKVYDISTNRTNQENFLIAQGKFAYIKHNGAAPTTGSCYIEIVRGA